MSDINNRILRESPPITVEAILEPSQPIKMPCQKSLQLDHECDTPPFLSRLHLLCLLRQLRAARLWRYLSPKSFTNNPRQ
jgi:hypothetical protein